MPHEETDSSDPSVSRNIRISDVLLLGAAAASWPLRVLAANAYLVAHPERIVAVALVAWLLAVLFAWVLIRVGLSRQFSVSFTFMSTVVFMTGGRFLVLLGVLWGSVALILVVSLIGFALHRLRESVLVPALTAGLAVALLSGPAVLAYNNLTEDEPSKVVSRNGIAEVDLQQKPDIYLIVLDGYPGLINLRDDYNDNKEHLLDELKARGFEIPSSSWSAYPRTHFSLASALDMSYPVEEMSEGRRTVAELYDIIGGQNAVVDALVSNGYETYLVESGWGGLSCDEAIDICISSHIFSEEVYITLRDTAIRPVVLSVYGHAFTAGSLNTMGWLLDNAAAIGADEVPSLVVAHVMAPHPPYHLDEDCRTVGGEFAATIQTPDMGTGFEAQMRCVDRFMLRLADEIDPEDVLLYVSDHGTNVRNQTLNPGESWSRDEIAERLNTWAAFRAGKSCDLGDPFILPNLFRRILDCHGDSSMGDLEARMFLPGGFEIDSVLVEGLVGG